MNLTANAAEPAAHIKPLGLSSEGTGLMQTEFPHFSSGRICPSCGPTGTGARRLPEASDTASTARCMLTGRMLATNFNQAERCASRHERPPQ